MKTFVYIKTILNQLLNLNLFFVKAMFLSFALWGQVKVGYSLHQRFEFELCFTCKAFLSKEIVFLYSSKLRNTYYCKVSVNEYCAFPFVLSIELYPS